MPRKPAFSVEITGLDVVTQRLRRVRKTASGKALRPVVEPEVNKIVQAAKSRAPVGAKSTNPSESGTRSGKHSPGFLRRAIGFREIAASELRGILFYVGYAKEAFYGRFLELGLGSGALKKGVSRRIQRRRERYQEMKASGKLRKRRRGLAGMMGFTRLDQGRAVNMEAKPFLAPAYRSARYRARQRIITKMKDLIERKASAA